MTTKKLKHGQQMGRKYLQYPYLIKDLNLEYMKTLWSGITKMVTCVIPDLASPSRRPTNNYSRTRHNRENPRTQGRG